MGVKQKPVLQRTTQIMPKIYINDELIDVVIQKEKNIGQIYDSLDRWLSQEQKTIYSIKVDQRETVLSTAEQQSWKKIATNQVERLDFCVCDKAEILLAGLAEWQQYLDRVGSFLFEKNNKLYEDKEDSLDSPENRIKTKKKSAFTFLFSSKDINDLLEGIDWMETAARSIAKIFGKTDLIWHVEDSSEGKSQQEFGLWDLFAQLRSKIATKSKTKRTAISRNEEILEIFRILKSLVNDLQVQLIAQTTSFTQLKNELVKMKGSFDEHLSAWAKINLDLQMGKDKQAMQRLNLQADELRRIITIINMIATKVKIEKGDDLLLMTIDGEVESFQGFMRKLLEEHLNPLAEQLSREDFVSIGDAVEYEFPALLSRLSQFIAQLLKKVKSQNVV